MCDSSDGSGLDVAKGVRLQHAISAYMQPPFFNDICVRIITTDLTTGLREGIISSQFRDLPKSETHCILYHEEMDASSGVSHPQIHIKFKKRKLSDD